MAYLTVPTKPKVPKSLLANPNVPPAGPYIGTGDPAYTAVMGTNLPWDPTPGFGVTPVVPTDPNNPNAGDGGNKKKSFTDWLTDYYGQYPKDAWEAELLGDKSYQSVMESYQRALDSGKTNLLAGMRNSLIAAGIPGGVDFRSKLTGDANLAPYASAIDDATIASASNNPNSAAFQLQKNLDHAQKVLGYQLAARGVLDSGEYGQSSDYLQKQYQLQSAQQMNDLLGAMRTGVSDYQGNIGSLTSTKDAAVEAIANRLAAANGPDLTSILGAWGQYSGDGSDGGNTTPPADTSTPYVPLTGAGLGPTQTNMGGPVISTLPEGYGAVMGTNTGSYRAPDGTTFTSKAALTRWLQARGKDPTVWATNNPGIWARLGA